MRTLILLAISSLCLLVAGEPGKQPNVLFILTDDQRADCIGVSGSGKIATPNIDRLAKEGVHFRHAFCTTSLCSPSRASILSGLYAHTHGVVNNFTEYPADMPSWPRSLQQAGWQTAYIGKYHMGEDNDDRRPGFDYFVTHKGQGKYHDTEFRINGGERAVIPGYYTTVVTDLAERWITERPVGKPWALMLGHKAPHSFYIPETQYAQAFDGVDIRYPESAFQLDDNPSWYRARLNTWHGIYGPLFDFRKQWPDTSSAGVKDFAAMIRAYRATILSVDDSVGRLLALLANRGELDNTIIVFTADNGILEGEQGMIDKRTMHEPSIRVPLVVRYPALTKTARTVDRQVLTVDFAPSLLDLCGVAPLAKTHGRSWARLARGENDVEWRTTLLYHYNYEKQFPFTPNIRGVRSERWKYIRYPAGDARGEAYPAELFDLQNDPQELRNLGADPAHENVRADLAAQLERLLKETGAHPDVMPVDEGIGTALPDAKIR